MPPARSTPKPPPVPSNEAPRPLRADARRNRERLLAVADEVFSERGADASMEDIARRAKVGIGTLYRHFPTREALLVATVEEQLHALARKTRSLTASASASPGDAVAEFLAAFVEHASTYRGLAASLGVVFQSGTPGCAAASEAATRLLSLAQAAGEIRSDIDLDDIVSLVTGIALAAQQTPAEPGRAQRLITTFVEGLRTPAPPKEAPPAPPKEAPPAPPKEAPGPSRPAGAARKAGGPGGSRASRTSRSS
ncbi:TetR/AcrR family transcriptional regulator [Sorangium cellulosum]|uniref:TetR/AcrR family transcriptional regulator n=1 Tax=Sorangium cellulosum TaxID=56 RepID=UPI003D9A2001